MIHRDKILVAGTVVIMAVHFLPALAARFPVSIFSALLLLFLGLTHYRVFFTKAAFFYIIYCLYILYEDFVLGHRFFDSRIVLFGILFTLLWIGLTGYYNKNRLDAFARVTQITLYFISVTVVVSILFNIFIPNVLRDNLAFGEDATPAKKAALAYYQSFGLMTYSFAHAVPLMFPMLVGLYKVSRSFKSRFFYLGLLLLMLALLFMSSITTAFGLGLLATIIALFIREKNNAKTYMILLLLGIVVFFWGRNIALSGLKELAPLAKGYIMEEKINDVIISLEENDIQDTQVGYRSDLYFRSWNEFLAHPWFGGEKSNVGGHSYFGDYLGMYGLVGFLPHLLFLFYQIRFPLRNMKKEIIPFYYLSLIPFLGLSILKAAPGYEMYCVLLFVLPGMSAMASREIAKQQYFRKQRIIFRNSVPQQT